MIKALFVAFSVLLRKPMYRPTNVAGLEKLLLDDMLVNNKVDPAKWLPLLKTHAARGTTLRKPPQIAFRRAAVKTNKRTTLLRNYTIVSYKGQIAEWLNALAICCTLNAESFVLGSQEKRILRNADSEIAFFVPPSRGIQGINPQL